MLHRVCKIINVRDQLATLIKTGSEAEASNASLVHYPHRGRLFSSDLLLTRQQIHGEEENQEQGAYHHDDEPEEDSEAQLRAETKTDVANCRIVTTVAPLAEPLPRLCLLGDRDRGRDPLPLSSSSVGCLGPEVAEVWARPTSPHRRRSSPTAASREPHATHRRPPSPPTLA